MRTSAPRTTTGRAGPASSSDHSARKVWMTTQSTIPPAGGAYGSSSALAVTGNCSGTRRTTGYPSPSLPIHSTSPSWSSATVIHTGSLALMSDQRTVGGGPVNDRGGSDVVHRGDTRRIGRIVAEDHGRLQAERTGRDRHRDCHLQRREGQRGQRH